jgi:hypothetical protein
MIAMRLTLPRRPGAVLPGDRRVVRGSLLGDGPGSRVAVLLEAGRPPEPAPLIADAYGFTERERLVTELVARLFFDHYAPRLTPHGSTSVPRPE